MTDSWANQLADKGFLTANGLVEYLREIKSIKSVSYPTMKRMIESGKIKVDHVGAQMRIPREEIERFLEEGNREEGDKPSSQPQLRLGSHNDNNGDDYND